MLERNFSRALASETRNSPTTTLQEKPSCARTRKACHSCGKESKNIQLWLRSLTGLIFYLHLSLSSFFSFSIAISMIHYVYLSVSPYSLSKFLLFPFVRFFSPHCPCFLIVLFLCPSVSLSISFSVSSFITLSPHISFKYFNTDGNVELLMNVVE